MKDKYKMKILKIILLTILVIRFSCYISLAAEMGASNYTKLTENIVAWKNIDNADIVLSNGQNISNLAVKKEVEIQEEEEEIITRSNLDLCLILDCSGSMRSTVGDTTRMDKLKSTAKNLLENLSNDFQIRVTIINFGVIFSDHKMNENTFRADIEAGDRLGGGIRLANLESDIKKLDNIIDNLKPEGNTPTVEAIQFANKCWDSIPDLQFVTRKTVLITDGEPYLNDSAVEYESRVPLALKDFKNNHNDIEFITLLVGERLQSIVNLFENGDKTMITSDENFEEAITDNLYNEISSGIFVAGEEKIKRKAGFFETDDGYNAIADEEILYGATLTVEYSIHVSSHQKLNSIKITDYIPEGMQVVSASYDGKYNPTNNTVTFENIPPEKKETVIYLTLSKVLTSAEDIQEMENTADVTVTTAKGETYSTITDNPYATEEEKEEARVHSKKLSIIPPFGGSNEEKISFGNNIIVKHWQVILLGLMWIIVILYFRKQIQRGRKSKKQV